LQDGQVPSDAAQGRQELLDAHEELTGFLDSVDASEGVATLCLHLHPAPIDGEQEFLARLWASIPVRQGRYGRGPMIPFVELHTRTIAWWLCYAWRARQLSSAVM
jgi:hypothetical protein